MRQSILIVLALVSTSCARSVEEWQHDLTSRWSDDFHRGMAAIALAEQAPDRAAGAVVPLLAILDGPDTPMRPHAAESLRKIAPWSAEEMVATLVRSTFLSEESRIPLEAAIVAAGERAVGPLVAAMPEPGRLAPEQIGLILARIGEPAAEPLAAVVREQPGSPIAVRAAWTLGKCGPAARRALPALVEALRGADEELAVAAAAALWRIDQEGAGILPALRESLADPRKPVRDATARSIAHVYVVRASLVDGAPRAAFLREIVRLGDAVQPSLLEKIAAGGPKRARAAQECLLALAARRAAGTWRR